MNTTETTEPRAAGETALTCRTRQGSEVRLLGFAAGSDRDSVWAVRRADSALRCYYVHDILMPEGVQHITGALITLQKIDKAEAIKLAKEGV